MGTFLKIFWPNLIRFGQERMDLNRSYRRKICTCVCVYAVVEKFNIALDLCLITGRLECIFYLLKRDSKRYHMDSKSRETKIWYRANCVLIEVLGEKKTRKIRFFLFLMCYDDCDFVPFF